MAPMSLEIDIPILEQRLFETSPLQPLAIFGLYLSAALPADIVEMLSDSSDGARTA
jgi:hypothetical protein